MGLGFMGGVHLNALRSMSDVEVALVSRDERKLSGDLTSSQGNIGGPVERFDFSGLRKYRELGDALKDP